ncbi:translation elongation factor Ts [Pseudoglutamicibacter cumminsii]|uniref:translation elongation factor Ts n=1 Tax=Pseudoglutamicibacter cumminsii TaxID=156979 RepID=UPI00195A382E|nr:translation elongation factor Ts [Pseudoglutamicibacter cumminsii]MBM7796453.1 elongation factor Ts [Pseudoglutamicibacter cumminsii]
MANYTTADIKELRERTGAGMMDVKKALDEADGDTAKALEIIRVKGLIKASKREGRATAEGLVAATVVDGAGYMLELNAETDFVAKNEKFVELANKALEAAVANNVADVDALLAAKIGDNTVAEEIEELSGVLGEKIQLRRLEKVEGALVKAYLHKTSQDLPAQVGVLFAVDGTGEAAETAAHDVAVHAAAMAPVYLTREDVPEDLVAEERRIAEETARAEGKPEQALPKIIEGRMTGFFKEKVLVDQPFAKDTKQSIQQVLDAAGVKAVAFARFRVGA